MCGPSDLRRTLTHVKLTGRLANVIYSMDTTGADFYAYQFKPLVKLLNAATTGLLVADEVGLGKTIEAGLIWTELRSRFEMGRLLVLCPAMLREKWQRELRARFGVEAEIVDATRLLERLTAAAHGGHADRYALIASLQGVRPRKAWQVEDSTHSAPPSTQLARHLWQAAEVRVLFDLTIIDEAHYLRNPETMTAALGRLVREVSEYVVLLSATPVHLKSRDLFELARLADPDTFVRQADFDDLLEANKPLVAARDRLAHGGATRAELLGLLIEAAKNPLLHGNQQLTSLTADLQDAVDLRDASVVSQLIWRLDNVNLLGHVVTRTRKREVKEWCVVREPLAESIPLSDPERQFYDAVTEVVRDYCLRAFQNEGFLLVMPQRQVASSMAAAYRDWSARAGDLGLLEEDLGEEEDGADREDTEAATVGPVVRELLDRVALLADYTTLRRHDSKYARLRHRLRELFREHPAEKVVLFSYFRPTLTYLSERLREDGIESVLLHGGTEDKDDTIAAFRERLGGTVLLASEVASEGVDLQLAWVVVNYDLPWNPMRVEQRIGRVDRLGQQSPKVAVWNLFHADTIDDRIYRRLYERLDLIRSTVGGLEPILGHEMRELARDLFTRRLTPEQEAARIDQTQMALAQRRADEERLEEEATHLVAHGDYILRQVHAARDPGRRISAEDLRRYVVDHVLSRYPGCEFRQETTDLDFSVNLSTAARIDLQAFLQEHRLSGATQLASPAAAYVRCRFENSVVRGSAGQRVEVVNQLHPIVRFVGRQLDGESFRSRPAVAVRLRRDLGGSVAPAGQYVFAIQRWSMRGIQATEQLHYAVARLDGKDMLNESTAEELLAAAATSGEAWLAAPAVVDLARASRVADECCLASAERAFAKQERVLRAQNEDRALIQERSLDKHLAQQRAALNELLSHYEVLGKVRLMAPTRGRLQALEQRVKMKRGEIAQRRAFSARREDVCVGLLDLVD